MMIATHKHNFKKSDKNCGHDSALVLLVKDGGRDVINYVNELKLKRTQLDT